MVLKRQITVNCLIFVLNAAIICPLSMNKNDAKLVENWNVFFLRQMLRKLLHFQKKILRNELVRDTSFILNGPKFVLTINQGLGLSVVHWFPKDLFEKALAEFWVSMSSFSIENKKILKAKDSTQNFNGFDLLLKTFKTMTEHFVLVCYFYSDHIWLFSCFVFRLNFKI